MSRAYRLPQSVRDVITILPMLAGAARTLRGIGGIGATSSNGVQGTLLSNGYIQYSGANLGLPFDVFGSPGEPVYGPSNPPPGVTNPGPVYTNTDGTHYTVNVPTTPAPAPTAPVYDFTQTTGSGAAAPAAVDYNASGATFTPEVLTEYYQPPAADPTNIGKEQGDTFSFSAGSLEDLLQKAGELAPWYVWAAGGGALILCGALMIHETGRKNRR